VASAKDYNRSVGGGWEAWAALDKVDREVSLCRQRFRKDLEKRGACESLREEPLTPGSATVQPWAEFGAGVEPGGTMREGQPSPFGGQGGKPRFCAGKWVTLLSS
jgi:hypothetical protein